MVRASLGGLKVVEIDGTTRNLVEDLDLDTRITTPDVTFGYGDYGPLALLDEDDEDDFFDDDDDDDDDFFDDDDDFFDDDDDDDYDVYDDDDDLDY